MRLLSLATSFLTLATASPWPSAFGLRRLPQPATSQPPRELQALLEHANRAITTGSTVTAFVHIPHEESVLDRKPFHVQFSLALDSERNLVINDGEAVLPLVPRDEDKLDPKAEWFTGMQKAVVTAEVVHLPHRPATVVVPGAPPDAAEAQSVGSCPAGPEQSLSLAQTAPVEIELLSSVVKTGHGRWNAPSEREPSRFVEDEEGVMVIIADAFVRIAGSMNVAYLGRFTVPYNGLGALTAAFIPQPPSPPSGLLKSFRPSGARTGPCHKPKQGEFETLRLPKSEKQQQREMRKQLAAAKAERHKLIKNEDQAMRAVREEVRRLTAERKTNLEKSPSAEERALREDLTMRMQRLYDLKQGLRLLFLEGSMNDAAMPSSHPPEDGSGPTASEEGNRMHTIHVEVVPIEEWKLSSTEAAGVQPEWEQVSVDEPWLVVPATDRPANLLIQQRDLPEERDEQTAEKRGIVTHGHHRVDSQSKPNELEYEDFLAALQSGGKVGKRALVAADDTLELVPRAKLRNGAKVVKVADSRRTRMREARRHRLAHGFTIRRLRSRAHHWAVNAWDQIRGVALRGLNVLRTALGFEPVSLKSHRERMRQHRTERVLSAFPGLEMNCRDVEKAVWLHEAAERTLSCPKAARKALYRCPAYRNDPAAVESIRAMFRQHYAQVKEKITWGLVGLALPVVFLSLPVAIVMWIRKWMKEQARKEGRIRLPLDAEEAMGMVDQEQEVEEAMMREKA